MKQVPGTGAHISSQDLRMVKFPESATGAIIPVKGGINYVPNDIEDQVWVGICTAISLVQNRAKANGRLYCADFQYLLQKVKYDLNWAEGSSIFNALRVGKNIGFLPLELWTHTTQEDRSLPYSKYVAKLQAIPQAEVERLIGLCIDKIPGYASINVNDPLALATAINDSEAGILCRYVCGPTWWSPSWLPKDINPLRKPTTIVSGHAIIMASYDMSVSFMQVLANTWGQFWNKDGCADINYDNYPMTEAWAILQETPVIPAFKYHFSQTMKPKDHGDDVLALQHALKIEGTFTYPTFTGYYGNATESAVKLFQVKYANDILKPAGLTQPTGNVGPYTLKKLNALFDK